MGESVTATSQPSPVNRLCLSADLNYLVSLKFCGIFCVIYKNLHVTYYNINYIIDIQYKRIGPRTLPCGISLTRGHCPVASRSPEDTALWYPTHPRTLPCAIPLTRGHCPVVSCSPEDTALWYPTHPRTLPCGIPLTRGHCPVVSRSPEDTALWYPAHPRSLPCGIPLTRGHCPVVSRSLI